MLNDVAPIFNILHKPKSVASTIQMLHSRTGQGSAACMSGILFPISFLLGFIIINNVENFQGPVATNLSLRHYGRLLFTSLDIYRTHQGHQQYHTHLRHSSELARPGLSNYPHMTS